MYSGFGLPCHEEVGGVVGQVWNRRESFLQHEPGQQAGYPDRLVTLLTNINNRFYAPRCNHGIICVLVYKTDQNFVNGLSQLHRCLIKHDPKSKIIDAALTQIINMGHSVSRVIARVLTRKSSSLLELEPELICCNRFYHMTYPDLCHGASSHLKTRLSKTGFLTTIMFLISNDVAI